MTTFTPSSGNVYADLGYADPEGMRATSALVMQLQDLIGDRPLATIATRIDLPEAELAAILRGHFRPHQQPQLADYIAVLQAQG
ncbi:hypothetical protein JCM19000A_33520 [Silvimonas sp. JCM 19000]